jgi:hypothetical protein
MRRLPAELRGLSEIDQKGLLTNMFRYAHSTQTGELRLVSILQNIRRTNIDRLVAISYQISVVDCRSRTIIDRCSYAQIRVLE